MTKKRVHFLYALVLSVSLLVAGICLIHACVGIYRSPASFSPEAVVKAFSRISIPVYIALALVIGGLILDLFFPTEKKMNTQKQHAMLLQRMRQQFAQISFVDPQLQSTILLLRRRRKIHKIIALGLLSLCSIVFFVYALNPNNFHQSEINRSMAQAMLLFFPCLAIPFAYGIFLIFYNNAVTQSEIRLIRIALNDSPTAQSTPVAAPARSLLPIQLLLLGAFLVLLIYGFFAGGTADVFTKAINICTECVGLG